ncbi:MAG TPA: LytTR family DNA-binding domain-containing protein [Thermoanaerobaculia bacterium]
MSDVLRVAIVDDEPLARDAIRILLKNDREVRVVCEASGAEAAALIARTHPDLMFLDIQMREVDGFALLDQIGPDTVPAIVFVTAFDRYALRAFEVHALDYLLKPFDDRRFTDALARAKERARGKTPSGIAELLAERRPKRLLIPARGKSIVVDTNQIDWVEAADYYVSLHEGKQTHLLRQTMDEIESQLDGQKFFRVHRSAIVNLDRVREVHPLFRGDCALVLADGTRLRLSRSRRKAFEALFAFV